MFSSLASVALLGNLTATGDYAFFNSGTLTKVTLPSGVTENGDFAFWGSALTELIMPDSVTEIGEAAFKYCTCLVEVTLGNGVTTIGKEAFYSCSELAHVYYTGTEEGWNNISVYGENQQLVGAQRYIGDHAAIQITNPTVPSLPFTPSRMGRLS